MDDGYWPRDQWPEDDGPDADWPDDWPAATGDDETPWPPVAAVPSQGGRGRRTLALALTATITLGASAGAVYLYKSQDGLAQTTAEPGASGTTRPSSPIGGAVTNATMLGQVVAVGRDTVTVGGGPLPSTNARVTSATRFIGADRSLAQVRVGDIVTVQITESHGVSPVDSQQDPTSQ
jgi:hypothetical protein